MGCWFKTCALSNLPIRSNEKVYVVPLEKRLYSSNLCETTSMFRPFPTSILCEYDDYGGGKKCATLSTGPFLKWLQENLVEPKEDSDSKNCQFPVNGFSSSDFFKLAMGGCLFAPNPITFAMFRKDVVDSVLDKFSVETSVWKDSKLGYESYTLNEVLSDVFAYVELLQAEIEKLGCDKFTRKSAFMKKLSYLTDAAETNKVDYFLSFDSGSKFCGEYRIIETLIDMLAKSRQFHARRVVCQYLRAVFLDSFLESVRRVWMPCVHEGSQNYNRESFRLLNSTVLQMLDRDEQIAEDVIE